MPADAVPQEDGTPREGRIARVFEWLFWEQSDGPLEVVLYVLLMPVWLVLGAIHLLLIAMGGSRAR